MRAISVALAFALTLGLAALTTGDRVTATLALPALGEVSAEWLDDGTPVFVVHHPDGAVSVLGAEHGYSTTGAAVAWCPPAQRFIGVWTATRFTPDGDWLGGSAPRGLERFSAAIEDGRVSVGRSQGANRRDMDFLERYQRDHGHLFDDNCWNSEGVYFDVNLDVVLLHETPFDHAQRPSQLIKQGARGTHLIRGVVLTAPDGSTRFCDALSASRPPRCAGSSLLLPRKGRQFDHWYALEGYHRVHIDPNGLLSKGLLVAVTGFIHAQEVTR